MISADGGEVIYLHWSVNMITQKVVNQLSRNFVGRLGAAHRQID